MENEVKGYLRSLRGKNYLCVGTKGYILYPETANMLRSILPEKINLIKFSTRRTKDTIIEVHISSLEDQRNVEYIDNSGTIVGNTVDCPHIFEDYNVPEYVYINYNPEW